MVFEPKLYFRSIGRIVTATARASTEVVPSELLNSWCTDMGEIVNSVRLVSEVLENFDCSRAMMKKYYHCLNNGRFVTEYK